MENLQKIQAKAAFRQLDRGAVFRYFLFIFVPIAFLVVAAGLTVLSTHIHHSRVEISEHEYAKVELSMLRINETLDTALVDLAFLVRDEDLIAYVKDPTEDKRQRLERNFTGFTEVKQIFDQVRYLDAKGQEQVRVNLVDRAAVPTPRAELQDKKHRYYFEDSIGLPQERVFVSRLDLNIEQKRVEVPFKPMVRLAAPVDVDGQRKGVVILNYLADGFLGHVRRTFVREDSSGYLLNADGFWLVGPTRTDEWAFMFDRGARFQDLYPDAWIALDQIRAGEIEQVITDRGVFTMTKIFSPSHAYATANSDPYWVVVSYVPLETWYAVQYAEHSLEVILTGLLLIILAAGAWRIALNRALRDQMDTLYQRRLVNALNESERRNTAVVEASDDVVITCTDDGIVRHANQAATPVLNIAQVDLVGRDITEFLMDPDAISARLAEGERQLLERERFETYAVRASGEGFPAEITVTPVQTEGYTRFSVIVRDITLRRSYEERLKRLANYDPLTGLANRVLLIEHLSQALRENNGPQGPFAVIMGDLDDFRIVNDTLGHVVGDEALKEAAGRIHQRTPEGGLACRFGGDEFVMVLPCMGDETLPAQVCTEILAAFESPLAVAGHKLYVGISLGVAFAHNGDDTATGLLQMADTAMYVAKDAARNTYRLFTADMHEASARRLAIQSRLAGAQARGDLSLHYQPLVDAKTHAVIGAEALMRWTDTELGFVGPGEFIPVAESTGMIIEFGTWALDQACAHAKKWSAQIEGFHVAVNISPVQLIGSDVVATVRAALERHDLDPGALEVEITEGLLIQDPAEAENILQGLVGLGLSISIDDFGTGYSSLSYLHRFPFSTLKIDRMFVTGLPDNSDDRSLVMAVLALAERQKLKVIGEGVEEARQGQWLAEQGCDILQGYLFGKAMDGDAFDALVNKSSGEDAQETT
ncbi:EAL domain-containing protein [Pseudomonadota bacterium]